MALTEAEKKTLTDLACFIHWAIQTDHPMSWILANVGHDCFGLLQNVDCFSPRTSGYSESLASLLASGG